MFIHHLLEWYTIEHICGVRSWACMAFCYRCQTNSKNANELEKFHFQLNACELNATNTIKKCFVCEYFFLHTYTHIRTQKRYFRNANKIDDPLTKYFVFDCSQIYALLLCISVCVGVCAREEADRMCASCGLKIQWNHRQTNTLFSLQSQKSAKKRTLKRMESIIANVYLCVMCQK